MDNDIIREFEGRITTVEQSAKQAHKRLDDIGKLTESVFNLASETKFMREDLCEVKNRVDTIEQQPAKRWDLIVTTIITVVITAIATYGISTIFH